jgi:hypothetical protein
MINRLKIHHPFPVGTDYLGHYPQILINLRYAHRRQVQIYLTFKSGPCIVVFLCCISLQEEKGDPLSIYFNHQILNHVFYQIGYDA